MRLANHSRVATSRKEGLNVTPDDALVVASGAAAATYSWWEPVLTAIPDVIQLIIAGATLVYVVFRAANEIHKFWRATVRKDYEKK